MTFRKVGTDGPLTMTTAQAAAIATNYAGSIKVGTQVRLSDAGQAPGAVAVWNGTAFIPGTITVSTTVDVPSIASAAQQLVTITVPGAALGDDAGVSFAVDLQGLEKTAYVSAANTVTILLRNGTGAAIDLASTTVRCWLRKAF